MISYSLALLLGLWGSCKNNRGEVGYLLQHWKLRARMLYPLAKRDTGAMTHANPPDARRDCARVLQTISLQITSTLDLGEVLTTITQGLVEEMGAVFARIWLLGPGDLCAECFKATS